MFSDPLEVIRLGLAFGAGLAAMLVVGVAYDAVFDDPSVRAETRAIVEAEATQRTEEALDAIGDRAERARAMRRYCADAGRLYDFAAGECRR